MLAGGLLLAWAGLWNQLRVDWTINDQYQYGWFVPPLALALLALRWADRPAPRPYPWAASGGWIVAGLAVLGLATLLPLRLIEVPNPDWRLIFWLHAGVLTALSLGLAAWCGGWPWVRHFAFPVGFLLMAVPWPSGLEQDIVQGLMRGVAAVAAEVMNVMAIPAEAQGNLIRVRGQLVGVDEACSGIRSLQTMLMGGCLLGELSRLTTERRLALLGGGLFVAMVANVFRSSLLVWFAAEGGIATLEKYHDAAGISVLFIVFAGLLWLNAWLTRRQRRSPAVVRPAVAVAMAPGATLPLPGPVYLVVVLCWLGFVEVGTMAWYRSGTPAARPDVPRWTVVPPASAPNFQTTHIDDQTARMLRYDRGLACRWMRPGNAPPATARECSMFFFRWEPGHASAAQADMHQPHICLTASGLTLTADHGTAPFTLPDGLTLPVRRYEFVWHGKQIRVFFVVWQDGFGQQVLAEAPTERWDRLRAVLERRANVGRQTLEFIVSGSFQDGEAETMFEREMASAVRRL